jgi:hypothetical protein
MRVSTNAAKPSCRARWRPVSPRGEVRLAWRANESIQGIDAIDDPTDVDDYLAELTAQIR